MNDSASYFSNFSTAHHPQRPITLAVDAMGGDHGVGASIPGLHLFYENNKDIKFLIYGDEKQIHPILARHPDIKNASILIHTERKIAGDEKPSIALRNSKDTSMRLAIEAVETGRADAVVSSGNTGALMALSKMILKPLPGIHRPALASVMPGIHGQTIMLDLGANVLVDAENLVQFAVMGAAFARAYKSVGNPSVGLLNVGSEDMKGPDHVRHAGAMLGKIRFQGRYHGFVEGNDITRGTVDVIVTDGYAGNIALKTVEGVGAMTGHFFKQSILSDPLSILGSMLAFFAFRRFKRKVDPRLYNGGVFLGLNGICVKSHGGSDATGFSTALSLATRLARENYIAHVRDDIAALLSQDSFVTPDTDTL